jgi:hypothetical protein
LTAISSAFETAHPEVQSVELATPTVDVKPLADSGYGAVQTINRYVTSAALISALVLDPQTAA